MKFNCSAEWPLDQAAIDWLKNAYYPAKLTEAIQLIQQVRAVDGHAFNPNSQGPMVQGVEVNIYLKPDNWTNQWAPAGAAGQFFHLGASGNAPIPDIWINWNREIDPSNNLYGRIVRHELIHFLLWLQYPPTDGDFVRYDNEWQNSQHGKQSPDKDLFLLALNQRVGEYYPINNSSWPGLLPTL